MAVHAGAGHTGLAILATGKFPMTSILQIDRQSDPKLRLPNRALPETYFSCNGPDIVRIKAAQYIAADFTPIVVQPIVWLGNTAENVTEVSAALTRPTPTTSFELRSHLVITLRDDSPR